MKLATERSFPKRGKGSGLNHGQSNEAKQSAFNDAIFNGAITPSGRALVACSDEAAVQASVRLAADEGIPVAVVAGGHDMWARSFSSDNVILDIRRLSHVRVDRAASEVTLGGGALTKNVIASLPRDLVTVTGTISSVGLTGFALGGGYGTLNSRLGLGCDNIRRARVVLADGSVAIASENDDADLLWALRGGGSGFGVVTSLTMKVHLMPRVLHAMIVWPLDHAKNAILQAQDLLDRHPVELSFFMGFITLPTGEKAMFAAPVWSGDPVVAESIMTAVTTQQGAMIIHQTWSAYKETFSEETDKAFPKGRGYHLLTRTLRALDTSSIDILIDGASRMPGPTSAIALHDFHGVPTNVLSGATAFALRDSHCMVEIIGSWDCLDHDQASREIAWAEKLDAALSSISLPGGYVNLLKPSDIDRAIQFYGAASKRLLDIKRRVDPADLFRSGVGRLSVGAKP